MYEITKFLKLTSGTEAATDYLVNDKNNCEYFHITEEEYKWFANYYKHMQEDWQKLTYYKNHYPVLFDELTFGYNFYNQSDGDEDMLAAKELLDEFEKRIHMCNPETSQLLATYDNGYDEGDIDHVKKTLYQSDAGDFFLIVDAFSISESSNIEFLTEEEAKAWAEKYLSGEEYEEIFGEVAE